MTLLTLAPLADSYDMFIAIFFCFIAPFSLLPGAFKAHNSGTKYYDHNLKMWIYNKEDKIPIYKTGQFMLFALWLVLGLGFFIFLGSDRWDIWFI